MKLNAGLQATIACFRELLEENPAAHGQTIPFLERTAHFRPGAVPATGDLRTEAVPELSPKLPQSFA